MIARWTAERPVVVSISRASSFEPGETTRAVGAGAARPDGDAIGSALACCQILRSMGKRADVVLRDGVPRIYRPLPTAESVVQTDRVNGEYEAAIILECDSIQRTRLEGLEDRFLINIDHQDRKSTRLNSSHRL